MWARTALSKTRHPHTPHPHLKQPLAVLALFLGHLGEGLPFMLHRIQDQTQLAAKRRGLKRTPMQYLTENLAVTCSGVMRHVVFGFLHA